MELSPFFLKGWSSISYSEGDLENSAAKDLKKKRLAYQGKNGKWLCGVWSLFPNPSFTL